MEKIDIEKVDKIYMKSLTPQERKAIYNKRWTAKNKDRIVTIHRKKIQCDVCNKEIDKYTRKTHFISNAHLANLYKKDKGLSI